MAVPGELIKKARESRGKKQTEIASLLDKTQSYITKLEKDELQGGIKGDELLKLAQYLQYDPFVFIGQISLEEGDLKNINKKDNLSSIQDELADIKKVLKMKIPDLNQHDPLEDALNNKNIRHIINKIKYWDNSLLEKIDTYIDGMSTLINESEQKKRSAG